MPSCAAADGHRLYYRQWAPPGPPRATLLLLNGVMSHSLWFEPLARPLMQAGLQVIGADRRGTGEDPVARGDAPSAKVVIEDVLTILRDARREQTPLFLAGWCWGAVLALNVLPELEGELRGLLLLAPGLHPTEPLKARMAQELARAEGRGEDEPCLESPIAEELFTRGPELQRFIEQDAQRLRTFTPRFQALMGRLGMGATLRIPKVRTPSLLLLAEGDRATDNAATERAFAKIPGLVLERVPGEHGLQFDAPAETVRAMLGFIEARLEEPRGGPDVRRA